MKDWPYWLALAGVIVTLAYVLWSVWQWRFAL